MYRRDPLSVRYDAAVHRLMIRAIRAQRQRRGVQAWVVSPGRDLRRPDAGGRSADERAFTRAAYYLVFRLPLNVGAVPAWSLRLSWGEDDELRPSARGRVARPVRVRVWPRGKARVPADRELRWRDNPALQSGGGDSSKRRF